MDPTHTINWSRRIAVLLSEDSDIPTDVTFKFVKSNNGDGEVVTPPEDGAGEVSAHRMILALVSPMFRKMFYVHNTVDMFAQEIIIEDTTAPAFRIFIDAIYGVTQIQESLKGKSVDEIFNVLYLVTKYDIPELVLAVQDTLSSFPLTDHTVLCVAGDGMDYWSTFQEGANLLLVACAKFLKAKLTHAGDVFGLIAENGDKMAVIHRLAVIIREITPPEETIPIPDLIESSGDESDSDDSTNGSEGDVEANLAAIMAMLAEDSVEDFLPVPPIEMD